MGAASLITSPFLGPAADGELVTVEKHVQVRVRVLYLLDLVDDILKRADCVIISTTHKTFKKIGEQIASSRTVIDGRNQLRTANKGIGHQQ